MEKKILRLLIVDDSPDDSELVVAAVRKGGYMIKSQRVQDLAGMQAALERGQWDVVLAELATPGFAAHMAHDLLRRTGSDAPFVVLAREIKDADLVRSMQSGARDVVLKQQLARLAPVIDRELRVADEHRNLQAAQARLAELEDKHRTVVASSREAICYSQDGMHVDANNAYLALFGYAAASDLEGVPVMNLIDKIDQARFKELLRKAARDGGAPQEFLGVKPDGTRFPVELTVSPVVLNGEPATQIVATDISRRKAVESKLQYLNQHDPLTGLYNRHYFLQELGKAVESARQTRATSALLYIDLNQLKSINDQLGYAAGDRVLIRVAKLFRECLGEDALVSRFGGDEFAALLPNRSPAQAQTAIAAIQQALKKTEFSEGGKTYYCQCALSSSVIDHDTESANKALSEAYHGSQRARPQAAEPAPAPTAEAPVTAAAVAAPTTAPAAPAAPAAGAAAAAGAGWAERLKQALSKDEFTLVYQPIVNLHGDAGEYFEVLLRLTGREGELIPAGKFMPEAERSGISAAIDRWVGRYSVEALALLHREGRTASFFVNVSAPSFQDKELIPHCVQALFTAGVKHAYLVFEVDEAAVIAHPATAVGFLKNAKKAGCRVALDNFGRDPQTLKLVREIEVDFVKLDGSFTAKLASDPDTQALLKAVIEVARSLKIQTVAKSVEKAENLAVLYNYGVDYVMGSYFQEADAQPGHGFASEEAMLSDSSAGPSWAGR